jgi:tRNA(Leu) C34 or U34 (ribose-2'-O)-methylase TrmL
LIPNRRGPSRLTSIRRRQGNDTFLTIRQFETTSDCVQALRDDGREIWVTDLSPDSIALDSNFPLPLPARVAIVFGRETDGCSEQIRREADRRIYIPLFGFCESLNLSVAAAMVMQHLFASCPEARGNLTADEKGVLRRNWYLKLTKGNEEKLEKYQQFLDSPPQPLLDLRREEKDSFINPKVKRKIGEIRSAAEASDLTGSSKRAKNE